MDIKVKIENKIINKEVIVENSSINKELLALKSGLEYTVEDKKGNVYIFPKEVINQSVITVSEN